MPFSLFSTAWLAKLQSLFGITRYQTKTLASNITAIGVITQLSFNNLQAGKTYRLSGYVGVTSAVATDDPTVYATDPSGNTLFLTGSANTPAGQFIYTGFNSIFTAQVSGQLQILKLYATGTVNEGKATLEELPNHTPTTDWT
jgi:hypothetical protein